MNYLLLAETMMDAESYTGWDKLGAVAVAVAMVVVLVVLNNRALNRVDKISDKHLTYVEKQTEVMTKLVQGQDNIVKSNEVMHHRVDMVLQCRKPNCPFTTVFNQQNGS